MTITVICEWCHTEVGLKRPAFDLRRGPRRRVMATHYAKGERCDRSGTPMVVRRLDSGLPGWVPA